MGVLEDEPRGRNTNSRPYMSTPVTGKANKTVQKSIRIYYSSHFIMLLPLPLCFIQH